MKTKTSEKIIEYIKNKGQASGNELADYLSITVRAVRKQLSNLLKENRVYRMGKPPQVYYALKDNSSKIPQSEFSFSEKVKNIIEDNFLVIAPTGERYEGLVGFAYWCHRRDLPIKKTALEYEKTIKKYQTYKKDGLIDGKYKIKKTFNKIYLNKVFYLDFYSIERFGKTKLGQLLLYAKQSQNRDLIKELINEIKLPIKNLIKKFKIDAVGFIPPTVKREVQFMRELERQLVLPVVILNLVKIKTQVVIPQKTLTKLEDRIENARKTIIINDNREYKTVLLIDDALGSGATLNETAKKIKDQKLAKVVVGLAITGSFSGFEVISEV